MRAWALAQVCAAAFLAPRAPGNATLLHAIAGKARAAVAAASPLNGAGVVKQPAGWSQVVASRFEKNSVYWGDGTYPGKAHKPYVACVPYKNGHSPWMNALARADGWCPAQSSCMESVRKLAALPTAQAFANRKDVTAFMVARNPLERALSGWLTFVHSPSPYNQVAPTFGEFVQRLEFDASYRQNPHWEPQTVTCDAAHIKYDYILHAEDRAGWIPQLVALLDFENRAPFDASFIGEVTKEEALSDPHRECPGYKCHASTVMQQYYTVPLMERVLRVYQRDVDVLGYAAEVAHLRSLLTQKATHATTPAL